MYSTGSILLGVDTNVVPVLVILQDTAQQAIQQYEKINAESNLAWEIGFGARLKSDVPPPPPGMRHPPCLAQAQLGAGH